jgi:pyruvate/2-oxoglutarate dehydrogenase complex dihydrolipoamide acyltransferase (E2) component
LLSWHKKQGEFVKRDENLIDIETDKVVLELPAPAAGVLTKVVKGDGGTVTSNEVIATIDTDGKAPAGAGAAASAPAAAAVSAAAAAPKTAQTPAPPKAEAPAVMPSARKIAADNNLDTSQMSGSGRGGRVTKEDVTTQLQAPAPAAKAPVPMPSPVNIDRVLGDRPEQRVAMSRLRQRVAQRLVESQSTAAILTTFNEVNMQPVMEMRNRYKEKFEKEHGAKLGFMSFFVKAAVHALKKYPGSQRVDRRHGYRLSRLLRCGHRGGQPARPGGADPAQLRSTFVRGCREADHGFRQARAGRQANHRRTHGWNVFHIQRRRVRFHALDADHQSAAKRDPGRACDQRPPRGGRWPRS